MPTDSSQHPLDRVAEAPAIGAAAVRSDSPDVTPANRRSHLWAWGVLLFMGVSWGLSFSLAKIAVDSGAPPLGITWWQATLGAAFLVAFTLGRGQRISFQPQLLKLYVICAFLGTIIPGVLFYYAAAHVPAGVLSITVTLVPILTVFLAAVLRIERFAFIRLLGVLLGMLAILLLVGPEQSLPDPGAAPWVLVACVASACYAGENLVIALRMPPNTSAFVVACGFHLIAALVLAPVMFLSGDFVPLTWPWGEMEWAIIGLAAVNALAYSLFIFLVSRAGPVFASQTAYVVTLSGVFWGILIFGEAHSLWIWLSLILMLIGLTLVRPKEIQLERRR